MNPNAALAGMIAIAVLFFVSFSGMVVFFDYTFVTNVLEAREAVSFVQTTGEIEDVVTTVDNAEGPPVTLYEFRYQYEVDGQTFQRSSRDGPEFQSRYPGTWDAAAVRPGDEIPVFYDAGEPSRATLDQSMSSHVWILGIILGIANLVLLYFVRGGFRIWSRYRNYRREKSLAG